MPSGNRIRTSVIVPCRNEARHIRSFLQSLAKQELDGIDLEVLIADGMSSDGTRDTILAYGACHPEVRLLDNQRNTVSSGLNLAIHEASGEVILRMDVHTEYASDYVRRCVGVLLETGADNVGGPALTKANSIVAQAIAAAYHSPFACGGARFHDPDYEGYVDTVTYGCWHRSTFDRIGLFDETLERNQDDEFNLRLTRAGGGIWQSKRIVSWYWPRSTMNALFRQYLQYGFWKVAVIRKHRIPASWRHLVPATFVALSLILGVIVGIGAMLQATALSRAALATLAVISVAYCAANLCASFLTARKTRWGLFLWLPGVFAIYHLSYGIGFLLGVLGQAGVRTGPFSFRKMMTSVTR